MTLGRTSSNAIKIKTDEEGGGLRAVNCACCVGGCDFTITAEQYNNILSNDSISISSPGASGSFVAAESNISTDETTGARFIYRFFEIDPGSETECESCMEYYGIIYGCYPDTVQTGLIKTLTYYLAVTPPTDSSLGTLSLLGNPIRLIGSNVSLLDYCNTDISTAFDYTLNYCEEGGDLSASDIYSALFESANLWTSV